MALAAQRFEAALDAMTIRLTSELAVPDLEGACTAARAKIEAATAARRNAGS